MAIKKYYDSDCNLGVLDGKTVAVIGFGSQGHAHSENLAESGVNVVVGLRKGSAHWEKASEFAATHENFKVMEVEEAAKAGDVVMMLVPDELCADIYNKQVAPYMTEGKALAFAHGFNIHFKTITAPKNVDVIMIAPKGPGHIVRRLYTEGEGCPSLICVEQDFTGKAKDIALAYASGIGAGRAAGRKRCCVPPRRTQTPPSRCCGSSSAPCRRPATRPSRGPAPRWRRPSTSWSRPLPRVRRWWSSSPS